MPNEHAITFKVSISMADLEYIVKKANRLGKSGRKVIGVYQQEDNEGIHVYFELGSL